MTKGAAIAQAEVWMGSAEQVGLVSDKDVRLLLPTMTPGGIKAEVVYTGPIQAPVTKGQQLAELIIQPEGLPETRVPLFAADKVDAGGFLDRMMTVSGLLIKRFAEDAEEAM